MSNLKTRQPWDEPSFVDSDWPCLVAPAYTVEVCVDKSFYLKQIHPTSLSLRFLNLKKNVSKLKYVKPVFGKYFTPQMSGSQISRPKTSNCALLSSLAHYFPFPGLHKSNSSLHIKLQTQQRRTVLRLVSILLIKDVSPSLLTDLQVREVFCDLSPFRRVKKCHEGYFPWNFQLPFISSHSLNKVTCTGSSSGICLYFTWVKRETRKANKHNRKQRNESTDNKLIISKEKKKAGQIDFLLIE